MIKFWSVINCFFMHWTKKLTLAKVSIVPLNSKRRTWIEDLVSKFVRILKRIWTRRRRKPTFKAYANNKWVEKSRVLICFPICLVVFFTTLLNLGKTVKTGESMKSYFPAFLWKSLDRIIAQKPTIPQFKILTWEICKMK